MKLTAAIYIITCSLADLKDMLAYIFLDLLIRKTLSVGRRPTKGITSVGEHVTRHAHKCNLSSIIQHSYKGIKSIC